MIHRLGAWLRSLAGPFCPQCGGCLAVSGNNYRENADCDEHGLKLYRHGPHWRWKPIPDRPPVSMICPPRKTM